MKHTRRKILMVLVTRNRPARAMDAYKAWYENSLHAADGTAVHSDFMVAFDDDDPNYTQEMFPMAIMSKMKPAHLVPALNMRATFHCSDYLAIGSMGDDHIIRTPNWDQKMIAKLDEMGGHGVVYGDDCNHGQNLATAAVVSSQIIKALGWMGLPSLKHMYTDNSWMRIGEGIGKIAYMPDVVIEHVHPSVNKAPMDAMYAMANKCYASDQPAYEQWLKLGGRDHDVQRVKQHLASLS